MNYCLDSGVHFTDPQSFFPTATIKCAHFHGLIIEKPIPDYKEFGGTVFEMAEKALDFVLSKISLSTGTRSESTRVATTYEIPRAVVAEAIINAVAHRDYQSKGSVQISVFKNRVEIQNPGDLPEELSLADLPIPHGSYPHNPLLANCLFLTGDIERYGTGTMEMCKRSEAQGLTTPQFSMSDGFKVTLWRATDQVADLIKRLVRVFDKDLGRNEIMELLDLRHGQNFRENYLFPAISQGYIKMLLPDKPTSPSQKYRLTAKGKKLKTEILRDRQ